MPNTGCIRSRGFKPEKYLHKMREFEERCTQQQNRRKGVVFYSSACGGKNILSDIAYSRYALPESKRMRNCEDYCACSGRQHTPARRTNLKHDSLVSEGGHSLHWNKLAPFSTFGKPTCGFNFSRATDNNKKDFGIMPSNLVKWRSDNVEKTTD